MLQRLLGRRIINQITITARAGFVAGVKITIDFANPLQRNTIRKIGIYAHQPTIIGTLCMGIKGNNLAGCMHTGIGTPGTCNFNRVIGNF